MIKNFIANSWIESKKTDILDVINPATEEVIEQCPLGSSADTDVAVEAAAKAFVQWRKTPAVERIQCLFRLKALMEQHQDELAKLITDENGKTKAESRGSVRRAIQMVETATSIPTLMMGEHFEDIARGIDCSVVRRPMGVFAVICPFNFPAMVPFWFWPFAVATGNTVVIKPSERVPLTQIRVMELIQEAGFPAGVVNTVNGGKEVSERLCTHPEVQGVSFVGSTPIAKAVYDTGCTHGKRVQALGGAKNFMVMLPDAQIETCSQTALESIIGCAGERCLAGSVILCVGDKTKMATEETITQLASETKVGYGWDDGIQMGPLISQEAKDRVIGLIDRAEKEGARVLLDGRKNNPEKGYFLNPTVLTDVTPEMEISKVEVFGPVVCIAKTKTFDEAIQWINSSEYGNTTTLFTSSGASARKFCYEVDPSMIGINIGVPAPMSFFSFGGTKASLFGHAKAHGRSCIEFFTDAKTTVTRWIGDAGIWSE